MKIESISSYGIAAGIVVACAATVLWWTPASTNVETPDFEQSNNFFPDAPANVVIPPRNLPQTPLQPSPAPPGGSPIPSAEGNMPPRQQPNTRPPGQLPGLNSPPSPLPVPSGPPITPPPPPLPEPDRNPCPIGLRLDPLLGICIKL
ncbi:hypothetical protein HWB99_gp084 [Mycobacterium phage DrLupo]|uniref:Uncharacterized protein n=1 Tax=Mycobacterium phage DrLupo TaxID=2499037 RepID=A0A3S9UQR5_9CAUD|nr:hypothetical protein HWB99_gp084 [Mycobacterium phage DrLupo]AZS12620.1 hypothetical protein SEA_DRLUPO_84 [Mycobacterium phage DrLupo]